MLFGSRRGLTLIELSVALFIGGVVISLVLFSWGFVARHTLLQKRKSAFYTQTELAASIIANEIRTSPRVLFFDNGAVTFIASRGGDTVTYRFSSDSLRKNGSALPPAMEGSKVTQFSVEKDKASPPAIPLTQKSEPQDIVLVITLGMQDRTGISSVIKNRVTIRYEEDQDISFKNKWNY